MPAPDLAARAADAGISLLDPQTELLETYVDLLRHWNKRINLTSLTLEPLTDAALERLLLEPLVAAREVLSEDDEWVDLGSGGGSPAIPMKIVCPRTSLTMVESKGRKAAFLREAVRTLELSRTAIFEGRFENFPRGESEGRSDLVTARAVKPDRNLFRAANSLLRRSGRFVLFRSTTDSDEASLDIVELEMAFGSEGTAFSRPSELVLRPGTHLQVFQKL